MKKKAPDVFKEGDAGVEIFVPSPIGDILNAVLDERRRQHEKWGEQNHPPGTWNEILSEEIGEYNEAQLHRKFGGPKADNVRTELVQVAAVAIAMLECWDRNQMNGSTFDQGQGIPNEMKERIKDMAWGVINGDGTTKASALKVLAFFGEVGEKVDD